MFKSKPIDANDNSPEADAKRFVAELMPKIYLMAFLVVISAGAVAVILLKTLDIIRILFFS